MAKKRSKLTSQEQGQKKKQKTTWNKRKFQEISEDPDPESREFIYDEIDNYHAADDKILLESNDDDGPGKHERFEAVLPLSDGEDEESDEGSDDNEYNDYYSRMAQKDEMASDIDEEDGDDLPDAKEWGRKKELYYNTDYVDQDYGGYHGSDIEMAEEEEKEALVIQKRLLQELEEDDFGIEWMKPRESEKPDAQIKEKITMDLSKLSKSEKLELLKKESPEFLELVEDYINYMTEFRDRLQPLFDLCCEGQIPAGPGADFIKLKHQLILIYCTNISFYLLLKCRGTSVRHHPVLKRLATYKKLLQQLKSAEKRITPQLQMILDKKANGEVLEFSSATKKLKQKLRILKKLEDKTLKEAEEKGEEDKSLRTSEEKEKQNPKAKKMKLMETEDEKAALAMYDLMKAGRIENEENTDSTEDEPEEEENIASNENEKDTNEEENLEKRGITYQIAKNKGLMPHRKKEYRNPRVKHRMKFRKAKIRRKGQVKEPRKELQRYGGEVSGIRIGVKHGIKLK